MKLELRPKKRKQDRDAAKPDLRPFSSVQNRFKCVKYPSQLYRWKKQVEKGGTEIEFQAYVDRKTYQKFEENCGLITHDSDIRKWALQAAREVGYTNSVASSYWIPQFKSRHGIVSRKINRFVTRNYMDDEERKFIESTTFVGEIQEIFLNTPASSVFNTDQSGFNLELHSGRTLAAKGSKVFYSTVQSKNALTHSYTIQPFVSADGKLMSPLFIELQEAGGNFGPRVKQNMFHADNIYVVASKSGKMSSDLFSNWVAEVYAPNVPDFSVLLLDSWGGATEEKIKKGFARRESSQSAGNSEGLHVANPTNGCPGFPYMERRE